jgi:hypothetical protein
MVTQLHVAQPVVRQVIRSSWCKGIMAEESHSPHGSRKQKERERERERERQDLPSKPHPNHLLSPTRFCLLPAIQLGTHEWINPLMMQSLLNSATRWGPSLQLMTLQETFPIQTKTYRHSFNVWIIVQYNSVHT